MIRYKLTTQDMKTRKEQANEVTWKVGHWVKATGNLQDGLCSDAFIHWYTHPLLAVLMNPVHANIKNPRLWEIETDGEELIDGQLKGGSRSVRLVREIPIPKVTTEQRVRFAILCAKHICTSTTWLKWADGWLSGDNRTAHAANSAASDSYAAAYYSAHAAAAADDSAACLAHAAAYASAAAARATANAAYAAAEAARATAGYAHTINVDLVEIAEEAMKSSCGGTQ